MKRMKSFINVLLCIMLIGTIFAGELLYCAHSTLMSPSHLSSMLDNDGKLSQLSAMIYSSLLKPELSGSSQAFISRYAADILNKTDQAWVKNQIYIGATGLHKYLASEATTLPTFDFTPLNAVIKESLALEIMKQPQTKEKIEKVKTILAVLNNKYLSAIINFGLNNQLVSMLLELTPIRNTGFSKATLHEIIKIYLSLSSKSTTIEQASRSIVEQMTLEALELDKLKNYFDANMFLEKAFGNDNPVTSFKTVIKRVNTSATLSVNVLFLGLSLLILINNRLSLIKLFKIILYCTAISSAFNFLFSALLINPISSQKLITQFGAPQSAFGRFLGQLCIFLFRDFGYYLALQSVLVAVIAAVLYILIKLTISRSKKSKTRGYHLPIWRITVVIVIFVLVFSWWNIISINNSIAAFHSDIDKLRSTDLNQSILNGLIEAGGMDFLKYVQKK